MKKDLKDIIYIEKKRFYELDLKKREYNLEYSSPFLFELGELKFKMHSWSTLLVEIANYLLDSKEKNDEQLIKYTEEWTNRYLFLSEPSLLAHKKLLNGLYIDLNHTSVHMCFILQDLLALFKVDINVCRLIVRVKPRGEKNEVRCYFYNVNYKLFNKFLKDSYYYEDDRISGICRSIVSIDKIFKNEHKNWVSLFLFNDKLEFAMVKKTCFLKSVLKRISSQTHK